MIDLGSFEQRLNSDAKFQEAFLLDPVGVLRQAGIRLSVDKEQKLRMSVAQSKMGQHIKINLELNFHNLNSPSRRLLNFT